MLQDEAKARAPTMSLDPSSPSHAEPAGGTPANAGVADRDTKAAEGPSKVEQKAEDLVSQLIKLFPTCASGADLTEQLKESLVPTLLEKPGARIACLYHPSSAGEATSQPHLRVPPLQLDHLREMIKGVPA